MRTKSENPIAKKKFLDAAQKLMIKKGFAATSLDDLCKLAGLTKGSFFHYFKSKEDLGKAVLERFCSSSQKMMQDCGCGSKKENDPLKRVYGYIDAVVGSLRDKGGDQGCLLGAFATELADTHPQIRDLCDRGFEGWAKVLKKDLKEAKDRYASRKDVDVDGLAEHMIAIVEGAQILARAKKDRKVIERNMVHLKKYLQSVFGR